MEKRRRTSTVSHVEEKEQKFRKIDRVPVEVMEPQGEQVEGEYVFGGKHLIASYMGCQSKRIDDLSGIQQAMVGAIESSGASILSAREHVFPGGGITSVYLLSESHASIHTYPEHASCFVDIFTCGYTCDPEKFHEALVAYFKPERISWKLMLRGESNADALVENPVAWSL